MSNQDKRNAVITSGIIFVAFNLLMFALQFFEPDEKTREGIQFVHGLLVTGALMSVLVIVVANVFFPKDEDDPTPRTSYLDDDSNKFNEGK